jgi:hypothetical protein
MGLRGFGLGAGMGLRFAMGLFLLLGFFQGLELGLAEHQILLSGFGFKRFQALGKDLQVMAQPNRAHPTWRNKEAPLFHLVSHSNLAIGRLLNGIGNHRVLNRFSSNQLSLAFATAEK